MAVIDTCDEGQKVHFGAATTQATQAVTNLETNDIFYTSQSGSDNIVTGSAWTSEKDTAGNLLQWDRNSSNISTIFEWKRMKFDSGVSVQEIEIDMASGSSASGSITEPSQGYDNTFILPMGLRNTGSSWGPDDYVRLELDTVNDQVDATAGTTTSAIVRCAVIGYDGMTIQRVNDTATSTTSTTVDTTISEVTQADTIVWSTSEYSSGNNGFDDQMWMVSTTSTTNVQHERGGTTSTTWDFSIMVMELTDGSSVEHLNVVCTAISGTTALATAVPEVESSAFGQDSINSGMTGVCQTTDDDWRRGCHRHALDDTDADDDYEFLDWLKGNGTDDSEFTVAVVHWNTTPPVGGFVPYPNPRYAMHGGMQSIQGGV